MMHTEATQKEGVKMNSGHGVSKSSGEGVVFGLESWEAALNQKANVQDPSLPTWRGP